MNEVGGQIKEAERSLCCEKAVYILQLVLSEAELGQWDEGGERRLFDYPQPVSWEVNLGVSLKLAPSPWLILTEHESIVWSLGLDPGTGVERAVQFGRQLEHVVSGQVEPSQLLQANEGLVVEVQGDGAPLTVKGLDGELLQVG